MGRYYANADFGRRLHTGFLSEALRDEGGAYGAQHEGWVDRVLDLLTKPVPAPPASPPPEPPATIMPGTPQNDLIKAQDAARANPRYEPTFDDTGNLKSSYCNQATCDIVQKVNGPMAALKYPGSGNMAVANDAARYLAKSPNWREVTPQDAQRLANRGIVVVGVQANPGGHGHMVTVRPEIMPGLAESLGVAPIVNNIGARINVVPARDAFDRELAPPRYYSPKGQ
jgi:hypothetical protein